MRWRHRHFSGIQIAARHWEGGVANIEKVTGQATLVDILDRVLDKGIVIDAWIRISLVGIDFVTVEARVVVASIETYLHNAEMVSRRQLQAPPMT